MRKLFLLFPAFLLSVAVSAATTNVDPGTGTLSAAITAASDGDILVLADGTYTETAHVAISKQLTIRSAENATPIVHQNTYRMTVNDEITIIGVTFESGHSNELLCIATTAADKTITIQNCTFRSAGYGVRVRESECQQLENIVIDNCVFENIEARAIYAEKRTTAAPGITKAISITNSTFAACGKSGSHNPTIEIRDDDDNATTAGPVTLIDHCTFYNCSPSQYTIYLYKIGPQATVSNCIVSNPSEEQASTAYHGYDNFNITNCLWYNCSSYGYRTPATSANIINSDPLFADAENGDFSLAGDFINDNVSPARNAGTDGSDLGDPRWYTPATYPTTDFATPYAFVAEDAELEGVGSQFLLETSVTPNYIRYADKADPGTATWYFTATRECYVQVTLNLADNTAFYTNNKHILEVQLYEGNNLLGSVAEGPAWEGDGFTENGVDKTLTGHLHIPAAGNYSVKLLNNRHNSKTGIYGVTFTYEGGALVNLPNAAIPFEDAILNGATRDGDGIHFGAVDRYAEWNVAATAGLYTFTFDVVGSNYGHYQLTIIDSESNTIYDNYKGQSASGSVTHSSIYLDGNYTIRVANTNPGADGYITSIAATAASDIFVLDENTTEDGSVAAEDGAHWRLMLRRTFSAGKYYSICIPIDSYDSELTNIFGTGYELWAMESAIQNGEEISLNFTQITDGSFVAGKPYLIKPTQNVENPTFSSHTIHNYTSNNTQSFAAADFIGSFYKSVIPAGESNLYLQNNNLYYSETNNTPIKGTRAWIRLKQSGSLAPARARIVLLNQVVTNIQLAEPEENKAIKTIENGQLIIIREGVRYNAMGVVMK